VTANRPGTSFHDVALTVNGEPVVERVASTASLADLLRDQLTLTGTNIGCEQGMCGACTVLVDGRSTRSCLLLAVQADGREIRTVEGLSGSGELNPLQQAFVDHHALQCGFCTPGFLMACTEILEEPGDRPSRDELGRRLAGNVCRCTGYQPILTALESVLGPLTVPTMAAEA
jgi:aerobic-type carbon monoxide dehydrogenase small subunit (CoxS/CutS family)